MSNTQNLVLWAGSLLHKRDVDAFAFQASIAVDQRLANDEIHGSRVHVAIVGQQGIIPPELATSLDAKFAKIDHEIANGTLAIGTNAEDIHTFLEGMFTPQLDDAWRMVHTGRSRNDQVALDLRLYLKCSVPFLIVDLNTTIAVLLTQAENHID
jgi:argininosuccinate lyase